MICRVLIRKVLTRISDQFIYEPCQRFGGIYPILQVVTNTELSFAAMPVYCV